MIAKKIVFFILFYFILLSNLSLSKENKILIKVNNEIITSVDILNEIKYLGIINKEFNNIEKNLKIEIAKNSLIREIIKNIELKNLDINFQLNEELYENIIKTNFINLEINTLKEFKEFFRKNGLEPSIIEKKIVNEIVWKQLIYKKFKNKVKIDKIKIKENILNKKKHKEYLLSEILVNEDKKKSFTKKIELIEKTIKEKNFSQAALNYSVSDTSKNGGNLGWIKESVLSQKIKKELNLIKIGELTKPIMVPGGFLILKIEDIKEIEKKIDINKEIQTIVQKQTNEQLSRLSNIYFNKIKKNTKIDEI